MGPLRHGLRRLTFDRFGAFGRRVLRTDNASLPHLQNKVIFGRVESRNEDGFYTVDIGFKSPSMFHEKELKRGIGTKFKEEPVPEIGDRLELYVRYLQNPMGRWRFPTPIACAPRDRKARGVKFYNITDWGRTSRGAC